MRRLALGLALLMLLAGCAQTKTQDPVVLATSSTTSQEAAATAPVLTNATAPTWVPGQHWTWQMTSSLEGSGAGGTMEDIFEGTLRVDVLSATKVAGRYVTLQRLASDPAHSETLLIGVDPTDFSEAVASPRSPDSCAAEPCDLAKELKLREPGPPVLRFPLAPGAKWDHEFEGIQFQGAVVGAGTFDLAGTAIAVHRVKLVGTATESGQGFTATVRVENLLEYAPALGHVVAQKVTMEAQVSGGGQRQDIHGLTTLKLTEAGVGEPMPLPEAFTLATGRVLEDEQDLGEIRLAVHPERFEAGTSWTFSSLGAAQPADVEWAVARVGLTPFDIEVVKEGKGESFTVAFDAAGEFIVLAAIPDAQGDWVDADLASVYVDQTITGTGACSPGASLTTVAEADDTCTGLAFKLGAGAYRLEGSATYAAGESLLPCGALAFYADGEATVSSAAWPEGDALVATLAAVAKEQPWELRWNPSLSAGSEVAYEVRVTTLIDPESVPDPVACEP